MNSMTNDEVKMVPMSKICTIFGGRHSDFFKQEDLSENDQDITVITPANIQNSALVFDEIIYLTKESYSKSNAGTIHAGDIVINKYSKPKSSPYRSVLIDSIPEDTIFVGNPSVLIITDVQCNPGYLQLIIQSSTFQEELNKISVGSMNAINGTNMGKIMIPLPSPEEQERLADNLGKYSEKHQELMTLLAKEIDNREKVFSKLVNDNLWGTK